MNHKNYFVKTLFFLNIIIILLSACSNKINNFPEIDYSGEISGMPVSGNEDSGIIPSGNISISLPLSQEGIEHIVYLYLLYKASETGDDISFGSPLSISLSDLKNYGNGLIPVPIISDPEGYSNEEIILMANSGNLPDIFTVKHGQFTFTENDIYHDLSGDFLDSYLNLGKVYPQMFNEYGQSGEIFNIPFHAKVKMLFMNREILQGINVDPILFDYPLTFNSVNSIMETAVSFDKKVVYLDFLESVSIFLPGTMRPDFTNIYDKTDFNRYDFLNLSYKNSIILIKEMLDRVLVEDIEKEIENPLFRIDYSDDVNDENLNFSNISRYPVPVVDRVSLPLAVTNIAVSKNSRMADFAKNLAVFIALDENAQLFRSRFALPEGYIPVQNNDNIWDRMVLRQKYGRDLYQIKNYMEYSFLIDPEYEEITVKYSYLFDKYIRNILFFESPIDETLEEMNIEADGLLNG